MNEHTSGHDPGAGHGLSRRRFLRDTAVATGGALVLGVGERSPALVAAQGTQGGATTAATAGSYSPVALTEDELTTLKAILARLIPADELGPGAVEADVHVYIDRSLAGPYADVLPVYQQNLSALNVTALREKDALFAALSAADQDTLLQRLSKVQTAPQTTTGGATAHGGATTTTAAIAGATPEFFPLLIGHTREGMFGDPMYGGNANFAGWDLIGYPGIKLVWTAEEQAIGTVVQPSHTSDTKFGGYPVP